MAKAKVLFACAIASSFFAVGCAPAQFQAQSAPLSKADPETVSSETQPASQEFPDQVDPVDPTTPPSPTDSDPRAPSCVVRGHTPIYIEGQLKALLPTRAIQADDLPELVGAYFNVEAYAKTIGRIAVAAHSLIANANSIGQVAGAVGHLELVADTIGPVSTAAGEICISTHHMDEIHTATARFALMGRELAGVKANIGSIHGAAPFVLVKDFEVDDVAGAVGIKFVNSHVKRLSGAGEVILQDSVVDQIQGGFAGSIKCIGTSRILSQPDLCR